MGVEGAGFGPAITTGPSAGGRAVRSRAPPAPPASEDASADAPPAPVSPRVPPADTEAPPPRDQAPPAPGPQPARLPPPPGPSPKRALGTQARASAPRPPQHERPAAAFVPALVDGAGRGWRAPSEGRRARAQSRKTSPAD